MTLFRKYDIIYIVGFYAVEYVHFICIYSARPQLVRSTSVGERVGEANERTNENVNYNSEKFILRFMEGLFDEPTSLASSYERY